MGKFLSASYLTSKNVSSVQSQRLPQGCACPAQALRGRSCQMLSVRTSSHETAVFVCLFVYKEMFSVGMWQWIQVLFLCWPFKISNSLVWALNGWRCWCPGLCACCWFPLQCKGVAPFLLLAKTALAVFSQDICKPNKLVMWFNISQKYSRGDFCITKACSSCRKTQENEGNVWSVCTKARVL